jgi:hypothetical protein
MEGYEHEEDKRAWEYTQMGIMRGRGGRGGHRRENFQGREGKTCEETQWSKRETKAPLTERSLNHADLRRRRVEPRESTPVIHDEPGANDVGPAVDRAGHEGDLEEGGEFVELGARGFGVDEAALRVVSGGSGEWEQGTVWQWRRGELRWNRVGKDSGVPPSL